MAVTKLRTGQYGDVQDEMPVYDVRGNLNPISATQIPQQMQQTITESISAPAKIKGTPKYYDAQTDTTSFTAPPVQTPAPVTPVVPIQQQPVQPQATAPTAMPEPNTRELILNQMRERLGILTSQKTAQQQSIMQGVKQAQADIQAQLYKGKQAELERLVNRGLANGFQGAEQSGLARNEILQRQLAAENQSQAVQTQATADINALDRQFNELAAQGKVDEAQALLKDFYDQSQLKLQQNASVLQQNSFDQQVRQQAIDNQWRADRAAIEDAYRNNQLTLAEKQAAEQKADSDRNYALNVRQFETGVAQQEIQNRMAAEQFALDYQNAKTKAAQDAADAEFERWLKLQNLSIDKQRLAKDWYVAKKKPAAKSGTTPGSGLSQFLTPEKTT